MHGKINHIYHIIYHQMIHICFCPWDNSLFNTFDVWQRTPYILFINIRYTSILIHVIIQQYMMSLIFEKYTQYIRILNTYICI